MIAVADDAAFLKVTADGLRALAESTPDLAAELRRVADELDVEAAELDGRRAGDASRPRRRS